MKYYLAHSEYIDWQHPLITVKALELANDCQSDKTIAKRCFEFVRDHIKHSWDYRLTPVIPKQADLKLEVLEKFAMLISNTQEND
ncbi:MAG: hypothetical protein NTW85_09560 [Methylococcales bacterium]|nr:hypothetical protein [Methylococcales bacterium]